MREKIAEALKTALKAQDKRRASTLRLISAAIQDRDIANRGVGKDPASDEEILQILAKMVKQREESAKAFEDGNRPELAAQELRRDRDHPRLPCRSNWARTRSRQRPARSIAAKSAPTACSDMGRVHGRAQGEVPRQDGFRQGQRHRQVDAAIGGTAFLL